MKIKFETFFHHFIIKKRPEPKYLKAHPQCNRFENSFSLIVEPVIHTFVCCLKQIKERSGVVVFFYPTRMLN